MVKKKSRSLLPSTQTESRQRRKMSRPTTMPQNTQHCGVSQQELQQIHRSLYKARKMVVLTGAGISCNAGIPDFRSSNGLYNMSQRSNSALKGKELFDISAFSSEESIKNFALFMSNLYSHTKKATPTRTHRFIAKKVEQKKVLRCYTQNIDGIEAKCQLNMDFDHNEKDKTPLQKWKSLDVVQLHGDLNSLSCTTCSSSTGWNHALLEELQSGELPECPQCIEHVNRRVELGKRTTGQVGFLRPSIVLYGENHPQSEIITTGLNSDLRARPDFLLVMGTSLKVHGVRQLVRSLSQAIHSRGGIVVLVNKDPINGWKDIIDYQVISDCDAFISGYESYERAELLKKSLSKTLKTPPATPKKCRIRDILNTPTPSPSKKRAFDIYQDDSTGVKSTLLKTPTRKKVKDMLTPDKSPRRSPRLQVLDMNAEREIMLKNLS